MWPVDDEDTIGRQDDVVGAEIKVDECRSPACAFPLGLEQGELLQVPVGPDRQTRQWIAGLGCGLQPSPTLEVVMQPLRDGFHLEGRRCETGSQFRDGIKDTT